MVAYVGVMSEGLKVEKGVFIGPKYSSVRVLCNPLVVKEETVGSRCYNIDQSYFKLDNCIYSLSNRDLEPGEPPVSFRDVVSCFSKNNSLSVASGAVEPLFVLFDNKVISPDGFSLDASYSSREPVLSARISEKFILDNLAKIGTQF